MAASDIGFSNGKKEVGMSSKLFLGEPNFRVSSKEETTAKLHYFIFEIMWHISVTVA